MPLMPCHFVCRQVQPFTSWFSPHQRAIYGSSALRIHEAVSVLFGEMMAQSTLSTTTAHLDARPVARSDREPRAHLRIPLEACTPAVSDQKPRRPNVPTSYPLRAYTMIVAPRPRHAANGTNISARRLRNGARTRFATASIAGTDVSFLPRSFAGPALRSSYREF